MKYIKVAIIARLYTMSHTCYSEFENIKQSTINIYTGKPYMYKGLQRGRYLFRNKN